mmetsp:Transcript_7392/g.12462  ORF Transcript_7392/g.12462 Transcript_7392/m.12462 type:complete len:111 (-) Transcript_7392:483-815(-)
MKPLGSLFSPDEPNKQRRVNYGRGKAVELWRKGHPVPIGLENPVPDVQLGPPAEQGQRSSDARCSTRRARHALRIGFAALSLDKSGSAQCHRKLQQRHATACYRCQANVL